MIFTEAQSEAILSRGNSILLSAGAGSGKTRVLTERLMSWMDPQVQGQEPENVDRFLVITFTRAAAGELRARIADAISARLRRNPNNPHLRRQILLCRSAQIGTIHSFCASILREYAGTLGISPSFRILEEERSERLRAAALERVLERMYEEGTEAFLRLCDRVGAGRDDTRLADLILKLHAAMQSHARPDLWMEEQMSCESKDILCSTWGAELLEDARAETLFWLERMEEALQAMQTEEKIRRAYEKSFSETAEAMRSLHRALSVGWDESVACFPISFPRITGIRNNPAPELAEELKAVREGCRKSMERLSAVFASPEAQVLADLRETAPVMRTLLSAVTALDEEFRRTKTRAGGLDFSDLEHLAVRLLTDDEGRPTDAAREISSRFTEVMVDEYQDVSRVQDQIFRAVSRGEENLFLVGDLKQSIYRFRLADPELFSSRLHTEDEESMRLIRLRENFRSRPEILSAVNAVFRRCMSHRIGGIDYGDDDALLPGLSYEQSGNVPELLLLPREEAENTDLEAEAELAAQEILRIISEEKIREGETDRPVRFGDIAVLLRSANAVGGVFRRVLLSHGIPVSAGAGGDFYGSTEVSAVFSMLSVMDQPHRDIPLISLLRSPVFGFSDEKLSLIRAASPDTDFYTALCASDDGDAKAFVERLRRLRDEAPDLNSVDLVDRITEELDLYALASAMPDGERRVQRLMDISAMAETFRRGGEYGLHRFVTWLRTMEKKNRDPETCSDTGNVVHILSIHRSKGLEFPVVFVCGLGRAFNRQDTRDAVLIHPELGLGPKYTDPERKLEYPTAARRAIERRLNRDMLSEEMRLLYVAMTRARERLILTACVRKTEELLQKAAMLCRYKKVPAPLLETSSNALLWLLPTAVEGEAVRLRICCRKEAAEENVTTGTERITEPEPELFTILEKNLTAVYPHRGAELLPSKLTATELKTPDPDAATLLPAARSFHLPEADLRRDDLSAVRVGTAMHLVLQQIDLRRTESLSGIEEEIKRLKEERFLTEEETEALDPERILEFFESEIGQRIRHAEKLWREFRFSLLTDAEALLPTEEAGEKILLQGVVDCCFLENGALVVVDYKTDRVAGEEQLAERTERYRVQLETYAAALERIFNLPVKQKLLCFLQPGVSIELT